MEPLPLNKTLIEQRIREKYREKARFEKRTGINRSTLDRWCQGKNYPHPDKFLALAGALDVDCFALFDVTAERLNALMPKLMLVALSGTWKLFIPTLAFMRDFSVPAGEWPTPSILKHYRGVRKWHAVEHEHVPPVNWAGKYRIFMLKPSGRPQVWHFAYRYGDCLEWFPYGCVRLIGAQLDLINFIGECRRADAPADGKIWVESFFGDQPTGFRIASLHPFTLDVVDELPQEAATVRFRYPGTGP